MNEKPESTKASSSLCDVASSAVQPNTLPPKAMGANSIPDLPSLRFSMVLLFLLLRGGARCRVEAGQAGKCGEGRLGEFDAELGQVLEHAPDRRALDQGRILGPRRELEAHDQRGVLD